MNVFRLIPIALFVYFVGLSFAYAHPPYLVKQKVIYDNENRPYILETWNGDGIFVADPYITQIRDSRGFVVARGGRLPYLCFSLEKCWALGGFPTQYDAESIKEKSLALSHKGTPFMLSDEGSHEAFIDYLMDDKTLNFRSYWLEYPETVKNTRGIEYFEGRKSLSLSVILLIFIKPFIYLYSNLFAYIPAFISPFFLRLFPLIKRPLLGKAKGRIKYFLSRLTFVVMYILLLCISVVLLSFWPLVFGLYSQSFSLFTFFLVAVFIEWRFFRKKKLNIVPFLFFSLDGRIKREHDVCR
ncbi:MAG: hypothetical protein COB36_04600 [Alphaproteobacteria bacterium]|nr:MAG: hypothetical protein COB36_04600 [Alphaproteobacteria bacterium]